MVLTEKQETVQMDNARIAKELVKMAKELIGESRMAESEKWGLRWTEDKGMKQVHKQKDFKSDDARERFIEKMEKKDVGFTVDSYSDPK